MVSLRQIAKTITELQALEEILKWRKQKREEVARQREDQRRVSKFVQLI